MSKITTSIIQAIVFYILFTLPTGLIVYSFTKPCDKDDLSCKDSLWWTSFCGFLLLVSILIITIFAFSLK